MCAGKICLSKRRYFFGLVLSVSRSESIVRVLDLQYHFQLFSTVSTTVFYTLEAHRVCTQKEKAANFNLLELRCCCGFYITFNFSRLIFYSNVFPTDKLPLLECLTFSLCCRKSAKEKTSQKKAERKGRGRKWRKRLHYHTPRWPRHCARTWHAVAVAFAFCVFNLSFLAPLFVGQQRAASCALVKFFNDH